MSENRQPSGLEFHKVLAVLYYVLAGLTIFGALGTVCSSLPFFGFSLAIRESARGLFDDIPAEDADFAGPIAAVFNSFPFVVIGLEIFGLAGAAGIAAGLAYAGLCLAQQQRRLYVVVVAVLACTLAPIGTALGIATLAHLYWPQITSLFQGTHDAREAP
jgi:hypothetical protein